jgi:hypothetical protein
MPGSRVPPWPNTLLVNENERDAAWAEVYTVLLIGWVVLPPVYDPEIRMWRVYARDLRGAPREYQPWEEAVGAAEVTALRVLAARFRLSGGNETA